jgi:hypothetical protein
MEFTKLNIDWNAEPNVPEEKITVIGDTVIVEFYLNYFVYNRFAEDDKGKLTFTGCHKYSTKGTNDEGYYMGQHRYKYEDLPWGEFYKLETDWSIDFAADPVILSDPNNKERLNHYLFFFRDSTFECVAADYKIEFVLSQ